MSGGFWGRGREVLLFSDFIMFTSKVQIFPISQVLQYMTSTELLY